MNGIGKQTPISDDQQFEQIANDLYIDFQYLQNRNAKPEDFEGWRAYIKERYPMDYSQLLLAVQARLDNQRNL